MLHSNPKTMNNFSKNGISTANPPDFEQVLRTTMRCSHYARRLLESDTSLRGWLQERFATPCSKAEIASWLDALPVSEEAELASSLRRLRKQVMLKLIARDLGGLASLDEVMTAMTALAEVSVRRAQSLLMKSLEGQFGAPIGESSGAPQELLVLGMGKLGGGELNVSSDIDLIFVYPEDGETNGERKLSNHEFFTRLGRRLITAINDHTADGYVFRVDMRLRPYGESGPLVMSFAALEEYLVAQGREWERYAWIKARVISPSDHPSILQLEKLAQPFVFRKYLDFGAFDSMRKLHAQIRAEVARRDRYQNIKLGPGGIREIEFIAQVFQLIRGGRDASLRIRPTRQVMRLLAQMGELGGEVAARLDESYVFLRNLEHRLQYLDDQQTQELPDTTGNQALIAEAMGYADYSALLGALDPLRQFVSQQFETVFGARQNEENSDWWHDDVALDELCAALQKLNYRDAPGTAERLLQFRNGSRYRQLPESSRSRMDNLVPRFATLCANENNADDALVRILALLEAIARRASYLAFLAEYPQALPRLVRLAASSAWAGEYLAQHPILLDELLDAREIYSPPDWTALNDDLSKQLDECHRDMERQMEALRLFQHSQTFHLLAMDLQGLLPLEILSDHLSDLADLILRHVLAMCWDSLGHSKAPHFAVIAYGKLGGRELGYASDLDLIFIYDDDVPDAGVNYAKLAKRINAMLSSYTASGRLYEVDLRLRPNGESGLLVSSVAAFSDYQLQHAWTWEHQALTRARFCAGDAEIGRKFEAIREQVLRSPRDPGKLRQEIVEMRQKMRDGHPNRTPLFDIKHDAGGMVDIEFIVQYLVLAHSHRHAGLTANSGNLALLKRAGELGLIEAALAEEVCVAYRALRAAQHRMRLNNQTECRLPPGEMDVTAVIALWNKLFLAD
ncbi:MAG TPA: bifunctional [glutamate--ammonia ligase]-adenylyl-L-tyrosine phosphorylase/[glutamate--ammonia-ligase] adenylyltransferase [Gallionellaceae bacterium]